MRLEHGHKLRTGAAPLARKERTVAAVHPLLAEHALQPPHRGGLAVGAVSQHEEGLGPGVAGDQRELREDGLHAILELRVARVESAVVHVQLPPLLLK